MFPPPLKLINTIVQLLVSLLSRKWNSTPISFSTKVSRYVLMYEEPALSTDVLQVSPCRYAPNPTLTRVSAKYIGPFLLSGFKPHSYWSLCNHRRVQVRGVQKVCFLIRSSSHADSFFAVLKLSHTFSLREFEQMFYSKRRYYPLASPHLSNTESSILGDPCGTAINPIRVHSFLCAMSPKYLGLLDINSAKPHTKNRAAEPHPGTSPQPDGGWTIITKRYVFLRSFLPRT